MERTLSMEEKIRKAEEIYNRRNSQGSQINIYENKTHKEFKFFNKILIQLIVCLSIYLISYVIINNQYVFSGDFKNKVQEIMKYDIEINNIKGFINSKIKSLNILNNTTTNTVEGVNNTSEGKNTEDIINANSVADANTVDSNVKEETQEEKDIREVNEKIKFVLPVVGVVSSRFGNRTPTTSTVPTYHTGLDIAAPTGTEIKAATNGKVTFKSEEGDYRKTYTSVS